MIAHFITAEIDLQATPAQLHSKIEAELKKQGELHAGQLQCKYRTAARFC